MATAQELITKFEIMVEDTLDSGYELELLNDAMHEVEQMAIWEYLKVKASFTGSSYTLDTNFAQSIKLSVQNTSTEYEQIPFEEQDRFNNTSYTYYIDFVAGTLTLTNTNVSDTFNWYYAKFSTDLAVAGTWAFPSRFHSIIPYKMAEIYYATDAGEKARAWDDRWSSQFERMLNRMYQWNDMLKTRTRRAKATGISPKGVEVGGRF